MQSTERSRLLIVESLLAIALLVLFLTVPDLPMVDLPQHAAQLSVWSHLTDAEYRQQFELNLRTPYLLSYLLAHGLSFRIGVIPALKLVVWSAVVGQVASIEILCRRLGHDPWLALLGVPLGLGYCFLFGLVSYIVALPFLYLSLALAVSHAAQPKLSTAFTLTLSLLMLLLSHGVAFAQSLMCVLPLLAFGKGSLFSRIAPTLVSLAIAIVWLFPGPMGERMGSDVWLPDARRLLELCAQFVGGGNRDVFANIYGAVLLVMLGMHLGGPHSERNRILPLGLALLGYIAFPVSFRGYALMGPRFGTLIVPCALLAFRPRVTTSQPKQTLDRWTLGVFAGLGLVAFAFRVIDFNRESSSLHEVAVQLRPGLSIRPVVFDPEPRAFPDLPALTHLPAYYFVEKGGTQGYSFALYPTSVIRYREGIRCRMNSGEEWRPSEFRPDEESGNYDCFIVHSSKSRARGLFSPPANRFALKAHAGDWFAYCAGSVLSRDTHGRRDWWQHRELDRGGS